MTDVLIIAVGSLVCFAMMFILIWFKDRRQRRREIARNIQRMAEQDRKGE